MDKEIITAIANPKTPETRGTVTRGTSETKLDYLV